MATWRLRPFLSAPWKQKFTPTFTFQTFTLFCRDSAMSAAMIWPPQDAGADWQSWDVASFNLLKTSIEFLWGLKITRLFHPLVIYLLQNRIIFVFLNFTFCNAETQMKNTPHSYFELAAYYSLKFNEVEFYDFILSLRIFLPKREKREQYS